MFPMLELRDGLADYADPGWYDNPARRLATTATDPDLARDGVTVRRIGS
jgi:hypothetical protein